MKNQKLKNQKLRNCKLVQAPNGLWMTRKTYELLLQSIKKAEREKNEGWEQSTRFDSSYN